MGCIKSSVHWHWGCLFCDFSATWDLSGNRVFGIKTTPMGDLYRSREHVPKGKHVCDKYNNDQEKISYDYLLFYLYVQFLCLIQVNHVWRGSSHLVRCSLGASFQGISISPMFACCTLP